MLEPGYVFLWKVRCVCRLTHEQCASLVFCIDVVREYRGWEFVSGPPLSDSVSEWPAPVRCIDPNLPKNHPAPVLKEDQMLVISGEYDGIWSPPAANIVARAKMLFDKLTEVAFLRKETQDWPLTRKRVQELSKDICFAANERFLWERCEAHRQKVRLAQKHLCELEKRPPGERFLNPGQYLQAMNRPLYEGKEREVSPELMGLLHEGVLSFEEFFLPLYLDSLQLKKGEVYKYCWANEIRQKEDVDGFRLSPEPLPQQLSVEPAASPTALEKKPTTEPVVVDAPSQKKTTVKAKKTPGRGFRFLSKRQPKYVACATGR